MAASVRWLHLSDFHVGMDDYAQRKLFRQVLDHVRARVEAGERPDLVFITGDIASRGQAAEYDSFTDNFLLPLYEVIGADIMGRTFSVPGNHDVDRGRNPSFERDELAKPSSRFFDPNAEGLSLREQFLPRFAAFCDKEGSAASGNWLRSEQGAYAADVEIPGHRLGIVGINTAWLSKNEHDRHQLSPGKDLLEETLRTLPSCDVRIVLGHHPLDWFRDELVEPIRALLGEYEAIYLHGHLHHVRCHPEDGAGRPFLAVQCGAAFQSREGEMWHNGLLWGEVDFAEQCLRLQPRHWNGGNRDWPVTTGSFPENRRIDGSDWWRFPLPGSAPPNGDHPRGGPDTVFVPSGWDFLGAEILEYRHASLDVEDALRFFNGGLPDWRIVLSKDIPRRRVVERLAEHFTAGPADHGPRVVLLVGPGGEGKSTALLQAGAEVLAQEPSRRVLWRRDDTLKLPAQDLLALPSSDSRWLVATDDADLLVNDLYKVVKALRNEDRPNVDFLLTCRDTDWIAAKGSEKNWGQYCDFRQEILTGLENEAEAEEIVRAWGRYGEAGLGGLAGLDVTQAAQSLAEASRQEAASGEGAFFGAMLATRMAGTLFEHVKTLLVHLKERPIPGGGDLRLALAYIAAMHAEDLAFLSRPVLAEVLGCQLPRLRPEVLWPLGREAAATSASQWIFTRHRRIAQAIVRVLTDTFGWDIDELYVELAGAASDIRQTEFIPPNIAVWYYTLPKHFSDIGRTDLAVRISQRLHDKDPGNAYLLVNLAKLLRDAGDVEQGLRLFREFEGDADDNRGFFYEWGTEEGSAGNQLLSVWLDAFSLSDQAGHTPPNNETSKKVLAGLGVAFGELYEQYSDRAFLEARAAVAELGLQLRLDGTARGYFQQYLSASRSAGVPHMNDVQALAHIQAGLARASEMDGEDTAIATRVPPTHELTYEGLKRLLRNIRNSRRWGYTS